MNEQSETPDGEELHKNTANKYEVKVSATVKDTHQIEAESADEAEQKAVDYITEEYGRQPSRYKHKSELFEGKHLVEVWLNRTIYPTVFQSTGVDAEKEAKSIVKDEFEVSEIDYASARQLEGVGDDG